MTTGNEFKKTPLNEWHRANGANMVAFAGWDMPVHYRPGIIQEHLATRKFGGLFDVSHMGRLRIRGKDRIPFLQHVLSNNAEGLEPWQAQYTLIPDATGGVVDDAFLYRFGEEDYLLVVNASNHEKDLTHLRWHAAGFPGVEIEDQTDQVGMIAFQGPLTGRIMGDLIEAGSLPDPFRNRLSEIILCGERVLTGRTGYTGEPLGFELFPPSYKAEEIWMKICEAGKDRGVLPVGLGARDTLRLEAGMPLHGQEFGIDPEGIEFPAFAFPVTSVAVSFSPRKGDFIGREPLLKQFREAQKILTGDFEGLEVLPRRIRPLALLERGVVRHGDEVFAGESKVGLVTSGTMTPFWLFEGEGAHMRITEKNSLRAVALGHLDASVLPDEEVEISVRKRRLRAKVVRWHGRSEAPPYFHPIPVGYVKPGREKAIGEGMEKAGLLVRKSLENHEWRQRHCVNLIPSEMTPSPLVRLLQVSDPVGRYGEHKELLAAFEQEVFYYQGTDFIAWVEDRLGAEMAEFLGCPLVETRPISGQMANMTVFSAFVDYKNRVDRRREPERIRLAMNNHIGRGGHLSAQPMGALRDYIAKDPVTEQYAVVNFPVRKDNPYRIDLEETAGLLERLDPEIIIFGKSMVLHPEPVAEIRAMVEGKKKRPLIMYDMAHVLGLVGPHFQEPFREGADVVTGSTHKTFFGTQRGVIGACFEESEPEYELWKAIRRRAFPGMVSNHHLGTLLGLYLAVVEMNAFKEDYQPQVIANAKAFARALKAEGLDVQGDPARGFTETHQVIIRVDYADGIRVARELERNNIIVNYQAIPSDESFTASSGLRIGVPEMTRFGMKEKDFEAFAPFFAEALRGRKNVGPEVARFREGFQTLHYCFEGGELESLKERLLGTF